MTNKQPPISSRLLDARSTELLTDDHSTSTCSGQGNGLKLSACAGSGPAATSARAPRPEAAKVIFGHRRAILPASVVPCAMPPKYYLCVPVATRAQGSVASPVCAVVVGLWAPGEAEYVLKVIFGHYGGPPTVAPPAKY